MNAASSEELQTLKNDGILQDLLVNAGWLKDITADNKNLALQVLMVHFILIKRKEPIEQFCKGLKTLGVLDLMRKYPDMMRSYFVKDTSTQLTSADIIGLFRLPHSTFGSTNKSLEDSSTQAYGYLLQGIKKLEEGWCGLIWKGQFFILCSYLS